MVVAIIVVWWISLVVALVLTIIAIFEIVRTIYYARSINDLATRTLGGAAGIAENTATLAALNGILGSAGRLLAAVQTIGRISAALDGHLGAVGRVLLKKGIA